LQAIEAQGSILLTTTHEKNNRQVGEFFIGALLSFAKEFTNWKEALRYPGLLWDSRLRDSMWTLESKSLLVIGLNDNGTEIMRRAKQFDMKTWGIKSRRSFHPFCDKIHTFNELHSILPNADVVCISADEKNYYKDILGKEELPLIKKDAVIITIGTHQAINAEALSTHANQFRGILIDSSYHMAIPVSSPLWHIPKTIITPCVASRPKSKERLAYKILRFNLRQYVHGNYRDMRNIAPITAACAVSAFV
jgi:phosphoglycerate dehydrogenase-like enzyme